MNRIEFPFLHFKIVLLFLLDTLIIEQGFDYVYIWIIRKSWACFLNIFSCEISREKNTQGDRNKHKLQMHYLSTVIISVVVATFYLPKTRQ